LCDYTIYNWPVEYSHAALFWPTPRICPLSPPSNSELTPRQPAPRYIVSGQQTTLIAGRARAREQTTENRRQHDGQTTPIVAARDNSACKCGIPRWSVASGQSHTAVTGHRKAVDASVSACPNDACAHQRGPGPGSVAQAPLVCGYERPISGGSVDCR